MIPAALSNAFYAKENPFVPIPEMMVFPESNNVIPVDFIGRTVAAAPEELSVGICGSPEWRVIATERMSALHRLADGWDGAGSRAISSDALAKADRILGFAFEGVESAAPPAAVPCADGSIQLEWWLTDTRFELCIEPNGDIEGWAQDRVNGHEILADGTAAIELLSRWSGRLTADKLVKQA